MPQHTIIKMCKLTPLHIGTGKESYESAASDLKSDTLTAALASIRADAGKTSDLKDFLSSFVLSSAFPYYREYLFLPRMQGLLDIDMKEDEEHLYRKQLKKVRFIETSLWNKLSCAEKVRISDVDIYNSFLMPKGKSKVSVSKSEVVQRVFVPRDEDKDAEPFFFDWHYYDKNAGLYCITDAKGALLDEIVHLFSVLGERGIGTDKSVGGGRFEVETSTISINTPNDANAEMVLSMFIPTEEELTSLNLKTSRYSVVRRGGFMAGSLKEELRHLRKNSVYMFDTGSLFDTTSPLCGKVVDLRPEWNSADMHPVYRSGRPFVLPVKLNVYKHE